MVSIFQSPVWTTMPSGVRIASAFDSGIECATLMKSTVNGPSDRRPPSGTTLTGIGGAPGSDRRRASNSAAANGVA